MPVIHYATEIHVDFGILAALGSHCRALEIRRPLLVTDDNIVREGIVARAVAALDDIEPAMFAEAQPNPMEGTVLAGLEAYTRFQCDGFIALGGGSVIDTAKAIGLLASNGGRIEDYGRPHEREIRHRLPPVIAIPTIAGSGSEVSRGLGVGVGESGAKVNVLNPRLFPSVALCDPELTISAPSQLTAVSSADALSHCIEGYISSRVNPPMAAVALDGMSRIWQHMETVVREPANRLARWEMMMGSIEGGMAMPKGLGAAHSLAIPLDRYHLQHGAVIAILLPKVIRWYGDFLDPKRGAMLAAIGLPGDTDLAEAIEEFFARCGLQKTLRELGVRKDYFDEIADCAVASPYHELGIKPATKRDYIEILDSAF